MQPLITPRLRLVPLERRALAALLASGEILPYVGGVTIDPDVVDPAVERAVRAKLEKMERTPAEDHPWLTYWLSVLRSEERGIGLLGFKGVPDARGDVEIGYGIAPAYRGRGLTTEAASRLIEWAFADHRCRVVTAIGVGHANVASKRVLMKLGARVVRRDHHGSDWQLDSDGFSCRLS